MWKYTAIGLLTLAALPIHAQILTPVWTELGESGPIARVVVTSPADCPSVTVDGNPALMAVRLPVPEGLRPVCQLAIPALARAATVQGHELALPHNDPSSVVVIGDTGCRIKGPKVQDCNDPAKWPFQRVATSAANSKPALVIHVGDYLYREEPCPANSQASCGGTPAGDTWEAWNADFFTPAKELLAAAPWAFSRGNHEACDRSWRGWFYYLDPRPYTGVCQEFTAPYPITLGALKLIMFDSASASDKEPVPNSVKHFAAELASIHTDHAWLVLHHPLWGLKVASGGTGGPPDETGSEVTVAWEKAPVPGIDLIISGHTHLFELLSFDHDRPTQLVAGDGGTEMAMPLPAQVDGMKVRGGTLLTGQNLHEFGYTALVRNGNAWRLALTSTTGKVLESATVSRR